MKERMRIYELARKMNIPNEDIITTLREQGVDVKSHSSTIDEQAVGLFIQAYGKKKDPDKGAKTTVAAKTPSKSTAKTAAAAPPPPVVKPRVLNRYRPTPPPGSEPVVAAPAATALPAAPETQPALTPPATAQPAATMAETAPAQAQAAPAQPAQSPAAKQAEAETAPPDKDRKASKAAEEPADEPAESTAPAVPPPAKGKEEPASKTAEEVEPPKTEKPVEFESFEPDTAPDDDGGFTSPHAGQAVRPMTPSVPVRIAAPSVRATPPRPPKPHRQTPAERHGQKEKEKSRPAAASIELPKVITLTQSLSVKELAEKMNIQETEIIKRLLERGILRTVNQLVELDLARDLAGSMDYEISTEAAADQKEAKPEVPKYTKEEEAGLVTRPPVVTIMGHVDHGKTSLLDAIRQTKFLLTDAEAGGITQHIGAYHVEVPGEDGSLRQIVFLDTPGHEAFTAMRARGAKATDIAILVVAADDGVMPQTIEAIDHAKAAAVPIIVAVNKIDKAGADPDRVLTQLMEHELLPDKFGGDTVTVNVSAKKRTGLDELLEMILLVADMQDLKANPDMPATGVVIEAEKSKAGAVASVLIENGTLKEGDFIVAGTQSGRVKALHDDRGQRIKAAGPSMPVEVLGLDEVPRAGDRFQVMEDAQTSRILVEQRRLSGGEHRSGHVTLESLHDMLTTGDVKDLNVIIKADVQGTAEAIAESVKKLSGQEVQVRVLRTASGDISETDVNLAASSNAIIIGFNVQPDQNARSIAESEGVDVRTYSIIYQITDDLEKA
ncbi:MAG TPA: translation initiation factor IF-2, partial [Chroococcales cyanobacterium]